VLIEDLPHHDAPAVPHPPFPTPASGRGVY